jgi:hypothetical protein
MEVFPGISMDPKIRFGKPCLTGTRIDVATVLGSLASGASIEEIESEYELPRAQGDGGDPLCGARRGSPTASGGRVG